MMLAILLATMLMMMSRMVLMMVSQICGDHSDNVDDDSTAHDGAEDLDDDNIDGHMEVPVMALLFIIMLSMMMLMRMSAMTMYIMMLRGMNVMTN